MTEPTDSTVAGDAPNGTKPDAPNVVHVATEHANQSEESLGRVAKIAQDQGGLPIRMRVTVQLWDFQQYVAWRGQVWRIEAKNEAEVKAIGEAMEDLFQVIALKGIQQARKLLAQESGAGTGSGLPGSEVLPE